MTSADERDRREIKANEVIARSQRLQQRMESLVDDLFVHLDMVNAELLARKVPRHD
jgi:hypothetical protein